MYVCTIVYCVIFFIARMYVYNILYTRVKIPRYVLYETVTIGDRPQTIAEISICESQVCMYVSILIYGQSRNNETKETDRVQKMTYLWIKPVETNTYYVCT